MRELKFRAWDKEFNEMSEPFSIGGFPEWKMEGFDIKEKSYTKPYWQTTCKILQFTGLRDRNGVDIYEGDILEDKDKRKYTVVFKNGAFRLSIPEWDKTLEKPVLSAYWINAYNFAVVGSIHENPELMEEK